MMIEIKLLLSTFEAYNKKPRWELLQAMFRLTLRIGYGSNKPQSLSLPEHMVRDYMTAECFESIKRTFKINHDISKLLKDSIRDSGLTLVQLEKKTGISKSAIQRYASGDIKKYQFMQSLKLLKPLIQTPSWD